MPLKARIAVSGSGMPTWTCSAQVGVRRSRPRIWSPISLVALVDDVRRVAERARGVDAGAGERAAGGADRAAQPLERARALDRVGADRRRGLHERLVDVVHDRALRRLDARDEPARRVRERAARRVEQEELLLHAEGEGRRSAEPVLHRVGIIGSPGAWTRSTTLVEELRRHALIVGEVTLTSGRTAQYYVDAKRAILRPAGFRALAELVAGPRRASWARPRSAA